jgi:hypothetical protein
MAIIKCQNCGNDVSDKAKQCPHCNAIINYENSIENIFNKVKENAISSNASSNKRIYNRVSKKFNIVIFILKFLGYFGAFITLIVLFSLKEYGFGLLYFVIVSIVTWLSTLILEAISEGLQLLEDIKNKL